AAVSGGGGWRAASCSLASRPGRCAPSRAVSKLKSSWPDSGFQRRVPSHATTRLPSRYTLRGVSGRSPSCRRSERNAFPMRRSGTCCSSSARVVRSSTRSRKSKRSRPRRSRWGATSPARTHWRSLPGGRPTMRAACAVSNDVSAAARPRPGTLLLLAAARPGRARRSARRAALAACSGRCRCGAWRRMGRLAGEALLERLHQVDHLGAGWRRLRNRDLLARHLPIDGLLQSLAPVVVVLLRCEPVGGELLDELARQRGLRRLHGRLRATLDLVEVAHLVRVVERVQREAVAEGTDQHEVLLAACHVLSQRHHAGVPHGLRKQLVGLLAA